MLKENSKKEEKNYKKILICITVIMLIFIISALLQNKSKKENKIGNSIGNLINYGYSAIQGDWVYYIYPNEYTSKTEIYRIKTNGKSKEKIVSDNIDNISSLNVYDDYIYFIGELSGEYSEVDTVDNKIYRAKLDGTDLEVINDNNFNNECREIYVINESIYFIGLDANIYKMNLDGSNIKVVAENGTGYLGINEEYIIYSVQESDDSEETVTYIMNIDGTNPRPLLEGTKLYNVNIEGDYVYYADEDKKICRTKIDSNKKEIMLNTTAYYLIIENGFAYYLSYMDDEQTSVALYKLELNKRLRRPETIKELNAYTMYLNVLGDYITFMDRDETNGYIYLTKHDGSETIELYTIDYDKYEAFVEGTASTAEESQVENENTVAQENIINTENVVTNEVISE